MTNHAPRMKSNGPPDPIALQEIYDQQAATYDQSRLQSVYQRRFDATERKILRRYLPKLEAVLEVGVGTGRLTNELLAKARTVTAVDISEKMLAKVREKYPQAGNLELRRADAHSLGQIPHYGFFDAAISMRMLPHIEDIVGLLRLLRHAVKPGGLVVTDFWNPQSYVYWRKKGSSVYNHYVTYPEAVKMLEQAGLTISAVEAAGFDNPFGLNLELLGRTPFKRFGYSLITICRRTV